MLLHHQKKIELLELVIYVLDNPDELRAKCERMLVRDKKGFMGVGKRTHVEGALCFDAGQYILLESERIGLPTSQAGLLKSVDFDDYFLEKIVGIADTPAESLSVVDAKIRALREVINK